MKKKIYIVLFLSFVFISTIVFAEDIAISNPIGIKNLEELFKLIQDSIFYLIGAVFVLIMILSGVKLMSSFGNPEELKKTKNTIWYCAIGLIVVLASQAIRDFVVKIANQ